MSRSQPSLLNPSQHFFEWKGGEGKLEFYDKDKQERVNVPLPFTFLVLDQLATITGYSKQDKSNYYSNEVRNTAREELTVKLRGQTVYTGLYKSEQGIVQMPKGASYAKSIYIVHKNSAGEFIIGNVKASGSALGAWIEFNQKHKVENGKVVMTRGGMQESPVGQFYAPEFEYTSADPDENDTAIELDKQLQVYLSQYFAVSISHDEPEETPVIEHTIVKEIDHQTVYNNIAEHESRSNAPVKQPHAYDEPLPDFPGDEPMDINDIPF